VGDRPYGTSVVKPSSGSYVGTNHQALGDRNAVYLSLQNESNGTSQWDGTLFVGTHQRSLDEKGRIALPSQFRDELGAVVLVSHTTDVPALAMWSQAEFEKVVGRLRKRVTKGKASPNTLRRFSASTTELRIDGQGRVTLPAALREKFNIDREAVVNGAVTRIEIWAPEAWEQIDDEFDEAEVRDGSWLG